MGPLFLGVVQFVDVLVKLLILDRVIFDFGDHDLVEQIHFPKLLVVAYFLVVLGVNLNKQKNTWICRMALLHDNLVYDSLVFLMQDGSDIVNFSHYFIFQVMELHVHEVLLC